MEVSELKKVTVIVLATIVAALSLAAGAATAPTQTTSLTIYSGREERLVKPIMDRFTRDTGIELKVRYASSTSLATALVEEGKNSPADIYWSQEPGTLGLVGARGLLARLPQATVGKVPRASRRAAGAGWGRAAALGCSSTTRTSSSRATCPRPSGGLRAPAGRGRSAWRRPMRPSRRFSGRRSTCTARRA